MVVILIIQRNNTLKDVITPDEIVNHLALNRFNEVWQDDSDKQLNLLPCPFKI